MPHPNKNILKELSALQGAYDHVLFLGEWPKRAGAWCEYLYTNLPGLARRVLFQTADGARFEDYRQAADLGGAIIDVKNEVAGRRAFRQLPADTWARLEKQNSTWPELRAALIEQLAAYAVAATKPLAQRIAQADLNHQLATTGAQGYGVVYPEPARGGQKNEFFDSIEGLIQAQISTGKKDNRHVVIGDRAIAQFIRTGLDQLHPSKYRADLTEMCLGQVLDNKWLLPRAAAAVKQYQKKEKPARGGLRPAKKFKKLRAG